MDFSLAVPRKIDGALSVTLELGKSLYVLGANGTGKSSLLQYFYRAASRQNGVEWIAATRQTWFNTNITDMSAANRTQVGNNIHNSDAHPDARWRDVYANQRPSITIYDLVNAENKRARAIAQAQAGSEEETRLRADPSVLAKINTILRSSNIAVEIFIQEDEQILAHKSSIAAYSITNLSDGERTAILIAAKVLTAAENSLFLIDEPERHLHPSIAAPLLNLLVSHRPDLAFVIATHDVMLPRLCPDAQVLLVRGCEYANNHSLTWDVDVVDPASNSDAGFAGDEALWRDIVGARRTLLFVEGAEESLDRPLFSLIFPQITVIAKGSCRDVESTVSGIRAAQKWHFVRAFGVVDGDGRTKDEVDALRVQGIYALPVWSIESLYYHPYVQRSVASRHAQTVQMNVDACLSTAKTAAIAVIKEHAPRLACGAAERAIREEWLQHLPNKEDINAGSPISHSIDPIAFVSMAKETLKTAINNANLERIIARYPVRRTPALDTIARSLGFTSRRQYEGAVRKLLQDSARDDGKDTLSFLRELFGPLAADMEQQ